MGSKGQLPQLHCCSKPPPAAAAPPGSPSPGRASCWMAAASRPSTRAASPFTMLCWTRWRLTASSPPPPCSTVGAQACTCMRLPAGSTEVTALIAGDARAARLLCASMQVLRHHLVQFAGTHSRPLLAPARVRPRTHATAQGTCPNRCTTSTRAPSAPSLWPTLRPTRTRCSGPSPASKTGWCAAGGGGASGARTIPGGRQPDWSARNIPWPCRAPDASPPAPQTFNEPLITCDASYGVGESRQRTAWGRHKSFPPACVLSR